MAARAWRRFVKVNRAVATAVTTLAAAGSRVTVHDYTLIAAVPLIRRLRPDVSIAYVHHTPWPARSQVEHDDDQTLVAHMARAATAAHAIVVSARRWKQSIESWSTAAPICVAPPGVDRADLQQRATAAAAAGQWPSLATDVARPIVAAVGRTDPAKNFDTVLRAWIQLVKAGTPGTLCVHLIPTTRGSIAIYRDYAERLRRSAAEANACRPRSVVIVEREYRDDALWLLQHADVVVACSRADGWNLVAAEAVALGPDSQRLILSATVGAAEVFAAAATIVRNPEDDSEVASRIRQAIAGPLMTGSLSRRHLVQPTARDWWTAVLEAHRRCDINSVD
jgi:glucosylglycerol-phosphate synthase